MHPSVAKTLTQRMHKGFDSTLDSQTPIVTGHPDPAYSLSAGKQGAGGVFGSGRDSQDTFAVVAFTKSKRAQSDIDDESWVPGEVAPAQNQSGCRLGDVHATIDANKGSRRVEGVVAFKPGQSEAAGGTFVTNEFTPTVQSQNNGSTAVPAIQQAMQVRRLTPTECERLQGFPDRYTDVTYRNKPAADGPRYKALGNSMAVPCMAWIGYRIQKATRH